MRKVITPIIGILVIAAALSCGGAGGDPVKALARCTWDLQGDLLKEYEGFTSVNDYQAFLQYEVDVGNMDLDEVRYYLELCREES